MAPHGTGPTRKSHTKSRKGCRTCKRRHIRCDETFPQWYVRSHCVGSKRRLIIETARIAQSTIVDVTIWIILPLKKPLAPWKSRTFSGLRELRARSKHGNGLAFSPFLKWICSPLSIFVVFPRSTCASFIIFRVFTETCGLRTSYNAHYGCSRFPGMHAIE